MNETTYKYFDECLNMEDPESENMIVSNSSNPPTPIKICYLTCRVRHKTLLLSELARISLILCGVQTLCAAITTSLRDPITDSMFQNLRWLPVIASGLTTLLYALMYTNLKSGGWGAEDSRFWCDVKIMYVRGFNTIRTSVRFFSAAVLTLMVAIISGSTDVTSLILATTVALIAEWQAGLSENQNQYDVRLDSKFLTEDNALALEPLHGYQNSHPKDNVSWSPFCAHVVLKIILYTTLFLGKKTSEEIFQFQILIQYLTWAYMVCVPIILDVSYLKNACSFCYVEIFRMLSDTLLLGAILCLSLV